MTEKYFIGDKIDKGCFGEIFLGRNLFTNEDLIIKRSKLDDLSIKNEAKIYNYLNNLEFIPIFKDFFQCNNFNNLVIEKMDNNLNVYKGKLNDNNFKDITTQIFKCLEFMHNKGIVHRDIKPNNFLVKDNKIKICDFGCSRQIVIKNKFIKEKNIDKIIGSPNYISLNVHKLFEPSMRDDIESAVYVIYYLLEKLDWVDNEISIDDVIEKKSKFSNKIIDYCRGLNFNHIPQYSKIYGYLQLDDFQFQHDGN